MPVEPDVEGLNALPDDPVPVAPGGLHPIAALPLPPTAAPPPVPPAAPPPAPPPAPPRAPPAAPASAAPPPAARPAGAAPVSAPSPVTLATTAGAATSAPATAPGPARSSDGRHLDRIETELRASVLRQITSQLPARDRCHRAESHAGRDGTPAGGAGRGNAPRRRGVPAGNRRTRGTRRNRPPAQFQSRIALSTEHEAAPAAANALAKSFDPGAIERRWYPLWEARGLLQGRRAAGPAGFRHPAAAAQRHRHPAHGARVQPDDHGRAHALPPHAAATTRCGCRASTTPASRRRSSSSASSSRRACAARTWRATISSPGCGSGSSIRAIRSSRR